MLSIVIIKRIPLIKQKAWYEVISEVLDQIQVNFTGWLVSLGLII